MLVKNWMSKGVMAIGVDDSIYQAIELQKKYDIHILPVIKKGRGGDSWNCNRQRYKEGLGARWHTIGYP
jgi:hypothetical protein